MKIILVALGSFLNDKDSKIGETCVTFAQLLQEIEENKGNKNVLINYFLSYDDTYYINNKIAQETVFCSQTKSSI